MPCYHPLKGYKVKGGGITFSPSQGFVDLEVKVPCGQCIGCRLERSRQWAMRCVHEMSGHEQNCFITLTFDDEKANDPNSLITLVKKDFQLFMKRLRKNTGETIRYYHCGEYGENFTERPHHHAILFGFDPQDKVLEEKSKKGLPQYSSEIISKAWQHQGRIRVSEANFESAAYVARYCLKKITGAGAKEYYDYRIPEYTTMSRAPGIGAKHYEKYKDEMWRDDKVIIRGKPMKPAKYYEKKFKEEHPTLHAKLLNNRYLKASQNPDFDDIDRLKTKEYITQKRYKQKGERQNEVLM